MSDLPDEFMTVAEVAALLKLNRQTVRNWIDRGELPAIHVGRRGRIRRSDFDRFVEDGYMGTGTHTSTTPGPPIWEGVVPPPDVP